MCVCVGVVGGGVRLRFVLVPRIAAHFRVSEFDTIE